MDEEAGGSWETKKLKSYLKYKNRVGAEVAFLS
jgi:hypothetical protein